MSRKRGRPSRENTKRFNYRLRISEGDVYNLNFIQEVTGKTKADILRDGLKSEYEKAMKQYLRGI